MSKINLNVSGKGQLNISNLAQGREVNITTGDISQAENSSSLNSELLKAVQEVASENDSRLKAIESNIQELSEALSSEPQNAGRIKKILTLIKEHHRWAFPAIAAIVKKVSPALGPLL